MSFRRLLHSFFVMSPLALGGCGYFDAQEAHRAQFEMVGMTGYDLQACAGIPGTIKKLNDTTEIWQYDITRNVVLPQDSTLIPIGSIVRILETFFGEAGSSCRMILRMDHDRVSEVHYSGNDDEYIGMDGICSLITRGCARQRESTMHHVGTWPTGPASSFYSPPTPPQSTSATYSDQSGKYLPNYDGDPYKPVIRPAPTEVKPKK